MITSQLVELMQHAVHSSVIVNSWQAVAVGRSACKHSITEAMLRLLCGGVLCVPSRSGIAIRLLEVPSGAVNQ